MSILEGVLFMEAHVFISRRQSDKDCLCVYIRGLPEGASNVELRQSGGKWLALDNEREKGETDKVVFRNLQRGKFYKFEGRYKLGNDWVKAIDATFAPYPKRPQLPFETRPMGLGTKRRTCPDKQLEEEISCAEIRFE